MTTETNQEKDNTAPAETFRRCPGKQCPQHRFHLIPELRWCPSCGTEMELLEWPRCPTCATAIKEDDWSFCAHCGQWLRDVEALS